MNYDKGGRGGPGAGRGPHGGPHGLSYGDRQAGFRHIFYNFLAGATLSRTGFFLGGTSQHLQLSLQR